MRSTTCLWLVLLARLALFMLVPVALVPAARADDFAEYALVAERNIFNPDRRAPVRRGETTSTTETVSVAPTTSTSTLETIDLLGTLISDKQIVAFVEGNGSGSSSEARLDTELGGWRVTAIDASGITLTDADRTLRIRVGERIERNENEDWRITERGTLGAVPRASSASSSRSSSSSGGAPGSESDILKRMRERREKENQ